MIKKTTVSNVGYICQKISSKLFNLYVADPHEDDKITADGMMRFLDDLGLNPESRTVLILAWKFGAATQCVFTKEEFLNGLMELG